MNTINVDLKEFDIFICHASEDKPSVARPLHDALVQRGYRVWLDEVQLVVGDSLSEEISSALLKSHFGVVVVSPDFFNKNWTQKELDGLVTIEAQQGKTILPVWHNVDASFVLAHSTLLAGKIATTTKDGIDTVASDIIVAMNKAGICPSFDRLSDATNSPEKTPAPYTATSADKKRPNVFKRLNGLQGLFGLLAVLLAAYAIFRPGSGPTLPSTPDVSSVKEDTADNDASIKSTAGDEAGNSSVGESEPSVGIYFQDCNTCPQMATIEAGEFRMGSDEDEKGHTQKEAPQRTVSITSDYALGRGEVTLDQFATFVSETNYVTTAESGSGCWTWNFEKDTNIESKNLNWRSPGYVQDGSHPVVCVSHSDAIAYSSWLANKTGRGYRLPTEAEWENAARAGATTSRFWGFETDKACEFANVADLDLIKTITEFRWSHHDCADGFVYTSPATSDALMTNDWGLQNMLGNAAEWTSDCWHPSYDNAPEDATEWGKENGGDCEFSAFRGGTWMNDVTEIRSAYRSRHHRQHREFSLGFRVAMTL